MPWYLLKTGSLTTAPPLRRSPRGIAWDGTQKRAVLRLPLHCGTSTRASRRRQRYPETGSLTTAPPLRRRRRRPGGPVCRHKRAVLRLPLHCGLVMHGWQGGLPLKRAVLRLPLHCGVNRRDSLVARRWETGSLTTAPPLRPDGTGRPLPVRPKTGSLTTAPPLRHHQSRVRSSGLAQTGSLTTAPPLRLERRATKLSHTRRWIAHQNGQSYDCPSIAAVGFWRRRCPCRLKRAVLRLPLHCG